MDGTGAGAAAPTLGGADRRDDLWCAYERMLGRLRRTAYRVLRDGHAAEDAVHDTMLAAQRSLHLLRDPSRLEPWLVRIVRNVAATQARRRRRCRPDVRLVESPDDVGDTSPAIAARLTSTEPSAESVTALREALDGVPPDWRHAFRERVVGGLTFEQIAAEQGVTVSCVKTRVSRVRARLERAVLPEERERVATRTAAPADGVARARREPPSPLDKKWSGPSGQR